MKDEYLIVKKKALPDFFEKVMETRRLVESGAEHEVSAAVRKTGISRSTYYKYKDSIFSPDFGGNERKAVLSMLLSHEIGMLSAVLRRLSELGASVLSISQSLPIHGVASIMITVDIGSMSCTVEEAITQLSEIHGVENANLVLVE
ncbi:MAG: ACT domain-containing protein [Sphaerochaetaceae bacterium]|jgi:chorismate mutase|nr:ACT domain-containing protein [Sphaerochaetaceae bacterium]MDD3163372.1 ACT domain-containing protein [Sphaerochaetaceae bacterium]MDD4397491.1 ACT domain-containing protein [Sphaerochaetaceae bacterium]